MNLHEFEQSVEYAGLMPLEFHLLDTPVILTGDREGHKYIAFSFAWTGNHGSSWASKQTYALAMRMDGKQRKLKENDLRVLISLSGKRPSEAAHWSANVKLFFKPWVREWLRTHPGKLVSGGLVVAKAFSVAPKRIFVVLCRDSDAIDASKGPNERVPVSRGTHELKRIGNPFGRGVSWLVLRGTMIGRVEGSWREIGEVFER